MKKIIIILGLCLVAGFSAIAQDVVLTQESNFDETKKPDISKILPEAGDFALGIDATPFLQYFGNFFGKTGLNPAPVFDYEHTIYMKYFTDGNRALRFKLHLNFQNRDDYTYVPDLSAIAANPLDVNATVTDGINTNKKGVGFDFGYEFRRGRTALQGFYGFQVGLGYAQQTITNTYGNPLTELNNPGQRTIETIGAPNFSVGAGGFVGVEYFFLPQMSIGGELNLMFNFSTKGQNESTVEFFDTSSNTIQTISNRSGTSFNDFNFGTVPTGSIFLMFHF